MKEPIHLWIGKVKDCVSAALKLGYNASHNGPLRIVNTPAQAVGYHNSLVIHLCGDWAESSDRREIKHYFDNMKAFMPIKFCKEQ